LSTKSESFRSIFDESLTNFPPFRIEEYWDPVLKGLDPIIVTRQVPAIHIFLSLDEIDPKTAGYQAPSSSTPFWPEPAAKQPRKDDDYVYRNKRNAQETNKNQRRPPSNPNRPRNGKPKTEQPTTSSKPQEPAKS
jgi:ribonucleases P/MRP protein subunit RPP25